MLLVEREFTYNTIRQGNCNALLYADPTVDGLKTGHTEEAGYCLTASSKRNGMRLIAVAMNAASAQTRADHQGHGDLCKVVATTNGKPVGEAPLVALADVERAGFFLRMRQRGWHSK